MFTPLQCGLVMEAKQFLSAVLGEKGHYCLLGLNAKKKGTKQKFYDSLDTVLEAATNLNDEGYDAYFALGRYSQATKRVAENVESMKSLFLDLDCGATKPYTTQGDALLALNKFRKNYKLPSPTAVVNSGRGLHIYWTLTRSYSRADWLPAAERLKAACIEFGLEADHLVTADAARVLRIPGTHNFKGDPPLPVVLVRSNDSFVGLEDFVSTLPKPALSLSLIPASSTRELTAEDAEDLKRASGDRSKYQWSFSKLIRQTAHGAGCGQVDKAIKQPNDMSYPEWLHVLSIAKHCDVDAAQAIHAISQNYEGYSVDETNTIAASIDSPHLCTTFEAENPTGCEGCPHKGKFKSPISLCKEMREAKSNVISVPSILEDERAEESRGAAPSPPRLVSDAGQLVVDPPPKASKFGIPAYPYPYKRRENGGVYTTTIKDGVETEIEVYHRDIYLTKRLLDPIEGPSWIFEHHTKREGIQQFVLSSDKVTGKEEFRKALGKQDIMVMSNQAGNMMNYIAKWVEELKITQDLITVRTQFGWTENLESYVIGDKEIFADRIEKNMPSVRTAQYIPLFRKKGTLEGWKNIAKYYNKPNFEQHQMMFGLSFGSPLMEFVPGIAGALFHLMSAETGYGKTTGMKGGASVWGNPNSNLILKGKDTGNSGWNRAEIWKNHVLYIDEISNYMDKEASDFCYGISDGEQKNRMGNGGKNEERYRGESWNLMGGTTGNSSISEKMTSFKSLPQGELARLIENVVDKKLFTTEEANLANELQHNLENHYGHAGVIYIKHVLNNMGSVEALVLDTRDGMLVDAKLESQHRYWVAGMAVTFAGLTIAKEIGLIDWDLKALYRWIINKLVMMKMDMKDMVIDIEEIVGQFYQDHPQGWLRVTNVQEIMPDTMMHSNQPSYKWVGRAEPTLNKLYIFPKALKDWCIKQGHHYASIRQLIIDRMAGKTYRMRAGRGTQYDVGTPHVIECAWSREAYEESQQVNADLADGVEDDAGKAD